MSIKKTYTITTVGKIGKTKIELWIFDVIKTTLKIRNKKSKTTKWANNNGETIRTRERNQSS